MNTANNCQTVVKVSIQMYPGIQLISPGKQSYFRAKMTQHEFRNPTYTGGKSLWFSQLWQQNHKNYPQT